MRRFAFLIFAVIAFTAMAAAVAIRAIASEGPGDDPRRGMATPVAAYEVEDEVFADIIEALGTARANESVTVTANVSDRITGLNFDSGDVVTEGQVLVELNNAEQTAGLNELRATLRQAEQDYERLSGLVDRGIAPRTNLEEASAARDRALAQVNAVESRLSDRLIRAPFDGVVGLRNVSRGEFVQPGDVIAELDDISVIKLDFTVPERFLSVLEPGDPIEARSSAYPDMVFTGEIDQIDSRVNTSTRAVTVRALIDNDDRRIRPGMLMTVQVRRNERRNSSIPGSAILRDGERTYVYVVDPEGPEGEPVSVERDVRLGRRMDGVVEIVDGLRPGETIIGEGVHRLRQNGPIDIRETMNGDSRSGGSMTAAASEA